MRVRKKGKERAKQSSSIRAMDNDIIMKMMAAASRV